RGRSPSGGPRTSPTRSGCARTIPRRPASTRRWASEPAARPITRTRWSCADDGRVMVREILGAGALYFALVFGAGFVVGFVRVLWLVPRVGERTAELLEAPLMLAVTIVAARSVVQRR